MRKTRLFLAVILAAFLLLSGSVVLADSVSIDTVLGTRIEVFLPEGVICKSKPVTDAGLVKVNIDYSATDWTEVLKRNASRDNLCVTLKLTAPDGYIKGACENLVDMDMPDINNGYVPDFFVGMDTNSLSDGTCSGFIMFAGIQMGQPAMLSFDTLNDCGVIVCWENADGVRKYEYVLLSSTSAPPDMLEVPVPQLTEEALSSISSSGKLPGSMTAEVELGGVTCFANQLSNYNDLDKIPLVIGAPAGAATAVVSYMTVEEMEEGVFEPRLTTEELPVGSDGRVALNITKDSHPSFANTGIQPAQIDYTIDFFSADDPDTPMAGSGVFTVWLLVKGQAPYPYYNHPSGAQPVGMERLSIYQGDQPVSTDGIYREAYGHAHLSSAGLDVTANPSGIIRMEVTPPAGAAAYTLDMSGSDFIYRTDWGIGPGSAEKRRPVPQGKGIVVYEESLFRPVQAGRTLVYLRNGITARYGGHVCAITWYDAQGQSIGMEYLSVTTEDFSTEVRNALISSESAIKSSVSEVTGVSGEPLELIVRHDPQSGENAVHYDLHMEDAYGVPCELGEETVFYIPYPNGYAYGDESVEYVLYHYSSTYQSYVEVPLEPTPYGLRFVEDHLSPFVLMWNAAELSVSPEELPQTGDNSPFVRLLLILTVSLASLACVMHRRRA